MNTIKETIKLVLGALLLGAAFYLIAALPGCGSRGATMTMVRLCETGCPRRR